MRVYGDLGAMGFELHKVNDLSRERAHYAFFTPSGKQMTIHHDPRKNWYYAQSRLGGRGGQLIRFSVYPVMCETFHGQAPTDAHYDAMYKSQHRRNQRDDIEPIEQRLHNPHTVQWVKRSEVLRYPTTLEFDVLQAFEDNAMLTYREVAQRFNIAESTVGKILRRYGVIA